MSLRVPRRVLRTTLRVSLALGAGAAMLALAVEANAWRESQKPTPLLPQLSVFRDTAISEVQQFLRRFDEDRHERCTALLDSLGLDTITTEPKFSSGDNHVLAALASEPCYISQEPALDDIDWAGIGSAFVGVTLLSLVLMVAVATIASYSHIGWRRIAALTGLAVVLIAVAVEYLDSGRFFDGIIPALGLGLLAGVAVPLLRECVLWVAAGFRDTLG